MILEGRVQTTDLAGGEGSQIQGRMTKNGALFTADAHGRYLDANRRGFLFAYNLTAVTALSVASTTVTGLNVYNPNASSKAVAINRVIVSLATLPSAQFGLALFGGIQGILPTGLTLSNTAIQSMAIGKGTAASSSVQLQSAATVLVATYMRSVSGGGAATEASQITPVVIDAELAGEVIAYPGTCVNIQAITTAVSVLATIIAEEVPAV